MTEIGSTKNFIGSSYAWYARSAPMFIALVSLAVGAAVWFPDVAILERIAAISVAPAALAILLGEKGRDRGRRLQAKLWAMWGGPLLTQYLRHRDSNINEHLKAEYHRRLATLLPRLSIPSPADELADPEASDLVYDACAQHLVNVVREDPQRFRIPFKENRSYGFRRNLWGLKPLGVSCSAVGTMSGSLWLYAHWSGPQSFNLEWLTSTFICAGLLIVWAFFITTDWVRSANDAYARRVLEAVTRMGPDDAIDS